MQEILSLLTAVLPTLCSTAILALAAFMYRQLKQLAGTKKAIKNLLKASILDLTKECRNKGYCTAHDREVLSELEESYHEHGGNSFISDEVAATKELPYEKED